MKKTLLLFATAIFTFNGFSQSWDEVIKAVASDRAADDYFGVSVNISGDKAIVGAYYEDEDASGGNTLTDAGSAYIFELVNGTWTETAKLVASDRAVGDNFGFSVSISGDKAIVGAPAEDEDASGGNTLSDAGSAYIFDLSGGTWTETAKLVASDRAADDQFGRSVSINGDKAIVGAYKEDEDASGGNTQNNAGSAYIFELVNGTWTETAKLVASDRAADDGFGISVSISGVKAIVGAYLEDEDASGGNTQNNAGSAYIFELSGGTWTETVKLVASDRAADDFFGVSVCISGDKAIVGASYEDEDASGGNTLISAGSAYIFDLVNGTWTETAKLVASDRAGGDFFAYSVSISGDKAIVGAYAEDEDVSGGNTQSFTGSAYIFELVNGTWTETAKLVASDRAADDFFGISVSISGDKAIVGAYYEDEDAAGGNTITNAGSAYIFKSISSVGIEENSNNTFSIYPNPTKENLTLKLNQVSSTDYVIIDGLGKVVKQGNISSQQQDIDVSNLSKGIYVISVGGVNQKFIKE